MHFLTDLADQAVILPMALATAVALTMQGWRRGAAAWALVIGATFATIAALKLLFLACSASFGIGDIRTPSGHVAAATVVAGGLAALLLRRREVALPLALLAAVTIGITRLALGMHSPAEVVIGAGVGLLGAWTLLMIAGPAPQPFDARRIAAVAALVVVIFHGMHLPAEAHLRSTAWRFAHFLSVCQSVEGRL
jgi:membrane-associated phospholipid phosphatase